MSSSRCQDQLVGVLARVGVEKRACASISAPPFEHRESKLVEGRRMVGRSTLNSNIVRIDLRSPRSRAA